MIKLLIDECLSTELVSLAIAAGYAQSSHVTWLGKRGIKDWHLINIVTQYDWTFVTNNSYDFRGDPKAPGEKGLHSKQAIHAGLICLNWPASLASLAMQTNSFEVALCELKGQTDLINTCLEINVSEDRDEFIFDIARYPLPTTDRVTR